MSTLFPSQAAVSAQPDSASERPAVIARGDNGCSKDKRVEVRSGRVSDPTEDQVSTVVVSLDANCNPSITEWKTKQPVQNTSSTSATESQPAVAKSASDRTATNSFEPNTIWGNFVRSSQTLQDAVNIDIAKLKWTHDRVWDDSRGVTRFKDTNESAPNLTWWGQCSTSVSWNHVTSCWYTGADITWGAFANSYAEGNFHTDWTWCNGTSEWQDLSLYTKLWSYAGGGYDVSFTQAAPCPGTHMATSKWTSTSPPPF